MEENESSFIQDGKRALMGAVNGVLLYDFFWPYIVLIIVQLILGANYSSIVDKYYYSINLILMILSGLVTIAVALFIAKPKTLLKAYNKIATKDIKLIFSTLGIMIGVTFGYNLLLLILGVDINGGNANQTTVVELIYQAPVLAFLVMVILAPILEEITYRYFVFGGLAMIKYKKEEKNNSTINNKTIAIILSGFIFMCVHASASFTTQVDSIFRELILLPPYMFSGMALAYAYNKSSNLLVSTSIHALNNLISFILCFI